jgi:hypothetical protein
MIVNCGIPIELNFRSLKYYTFYKIEYILPKLMGCHMSQA